MVKTGALTKVEKFYIENNFDKMTINELSKELDRSIKIVGKYVTTVQGELKENPPPEKTTEEIKNEAQMFQLMGRHERKGQHVATVMTKAASELADATRPGRIQSKKLQESIHRPINR